MQKKQVVTEQPGEEDRIEIRTHWLRPNRGESHQGGGKQQPGHGCRL